MATYEVFVDDNYHHMDESARYSAGTFTIYDDALAKAKGIVDEFLQDAHRPGMTSAELYQGYTGFGEDPFIIPEGEPRFSAWDYARERCRELCRDEDAVADVLRFAAWPAEVAGFVDVLTAALGRADLGAEQRGLLLALRQAVETFPQGLPRGERRSWLRLEHGDVAFTTYLYPDRFELYAQDSTPARVHWQVRFWGSGRCDQRDGDGRAALAAMVEAARDPHYVLKADA